MDSLADSTAEGVWPEIVGRIGALVIDEAHHISAKRWTSFREAFSGKPILQFTATPFRRDGQLVDGHVIYSYPLLRAQQDKHFKPITFEPVYETLAANADQAIAETAVARLREDLSQGLNHLMMARCSRIVRARAVFDIYETLAPDLKPRSFTRTWRNPAGDHALKPVTVGSSSASTCFGEGFDLPEQKVAASMTSQELGDLAAVHRARSLAALPRISAMLPSFQTLPSPTCPKRSRGFYSEDADWNELLSELSSAAAQEHAGSQIFLRNRSAWDSGPDDEECRFHIS